jgi:hypothetical protein
MSETSVGIQFNPSLRPGVTLALDATNPERLLVRTRLGPVRILFGVLVAGLASYGQLDAWNERAWAKLTFATLAALGGIAIVALRRVLVLDRRRGAVEVSRGFLVPHFSRSEPLEQFSRVSIHVGGQSSDRGVTTAYPVQLEGRDVKIEIDEPGYWEPARNLGEEIASFVRLPLHDPDRSGKVGPDDLDRTAGRRDGHVNPVSQPRTLRCRIEEETDARLRVYIPNPDPQPFIGLCLLVGCFLLIPLSIDAFIPLLAGRRVDLADAAIPVFILAWVVFNGVGAALTHGGGLEVTPASLRMSFLRPWGVRVLTIPASELEDLLILEPEMGGPRSLLAYFSDGVLVARSDRESVRFGYGMKRNELAWLRAKIVSVLGRRDPQAPRPKRHQTASRWDGPAIGLGFGILVAHVTTGPLAVCINVPFLQHVLSVGAAVGLAAGLVVRRLMGHGLFAVIVAVLLSVGWRAGSESVQDQPRLAENPRYLKSSESTDNRRYVAGFIPVALGLNTVSLELTLALAERIWLRRRRQSVTKGT